MDLTHVRWKVEGDIPYPLFSLKGSVLDHFALQTNIWKEC